MEGDLTVGQQVLLLSDPYIKGTVIDKDGKIKSGPESICDRAKQTGKIVEVFRPEDPLYKVETARDAERPQVHCGGYWYKRNQLQVV